MGVRNGFDYDTAFARNLGLLSEPDQARLREARVALPGLGGVGGAHVLALARLGIGAFHLADPDVFEVANFNRQFGARMGTVGRGKAEVMAETARQINPEVDVEAFPKAISRWNIDGFLGGVDVVVDGIDFFQIEARRLLYGACRERGIPVVNAGPVGFGAAVLVFGAAGMSFEEYFGIEEGMTRAEQLAAQALGLSPGLVSDMDPSRVRIEEQKGPALASTCLLCAAVAATEVLKLICGRGASLSAPRGHYYDPFRCRTVRLRRRPALRRGLRGRLLRWLIFRRFPEMRALHERELKDRKDESRTGTKAEERKTGKAQKASRKQGTKCNSALASP